MPIAEVRLGSLAGGTDALKRQSPATQGFAENLRLGIDPAESADQ
jgi:hypothetical protein